MKKLLLALSILFSNHCISQVSARCPVCPPSFAGASSGWVLTDSSNVARWRPPAGVTGGTPTEVLYYDADGNVTSDAGFVRDPAGTTGFSSNQGDVSIFVSEAGYYAGIGAFEVALDVDTSKFSFRHTTTNDTLNIIVGDTVFLRSNVRIRIDSFMVPNYSVSGTYTPTYTGTANTSSVSGTVAQYMRMGNTVTVSGEFTADPTLTATSTSLSITLPVASAITNTFEVGGTAFCGAIAAQGAAINANTTTDVATVTWVSADITNQTWSYTFTYLIK